MSDGPFFLDFYKILLQGEWNHSCRKRESLGKQKDPKVGQKNEKITRLGNMKPADKRFDAFLELPAVTPHIRVKQEAGKSATRSLRDSHKLWKNTALLN